MNKTVKIIVEILLALAAVGCVYGIYNSIMKPVNFNKEKARRQEVAVQRLKDIRTLEVAFSLINFYNNGKMDITMQIGSKDDSLAWENTRKITETRDFKKMSKAEQDAKFLELYRKAGFIHVPYLPCQVLEKPGKPFCPADISTASPISSTRRCVCRRHNSPPPPSCL